MANDATSKRLLQALAHHENAAATLRAALALVSEAPRAKYVRKGATNGHTNGNGHLPAMFQEAIAIDATRRATATKKPTRGKKKRSPSTKNELLAQRQRTSEFLAEFDLQKPRPKDEVSLRKNLGVLVRRGYLKAKGAGYVRTGKLYHVDPREVKW